MEKFGNYTLYQCSKCTNGFWYPLKMPSGDWYANAESHSNPGFRCTYSHLHAPSTELYLYHKQFFKTPPANSGMLLDVGCGNGSFMTAASKKNFDVWGLDFDYKSVQAAKKHGLQNIFAQSISQFKKFHPKMKFDVITFFEVLEHQDNPVTFITDVKRLLRKGGRIAGSVPLHKKMMPSGQFDRPPNHFILFTQDGLRTFLESNGFESIRLVPLEMLSKEDEMRFGIGVNSATLFSIMDISAWDVKNNSMRYKAYYLIRGISRFFIPLLNTGISVLFKIKGKKATEQLQDSFFSQGLYFQARLP